MKKVIIHFPVYFLLTVLFILSSCTQNEDIYNFVPPQLSVDENTLAFGAETGSLTFNIENSGSGTLNWNISEDKPWLSVSPNNGSTTTETDIITVTVDRTALSDGDYSAQIDVTSDWGNETINVTMAVVTAELKIEGQNPLVFGISTASLTFNIANSGSGTLNWNISEDKPWLSVSPNNGSTTTETDIITVTVDRTGLSDGDYSAQINVTSNGGNETVNVTMEVAPGKWLYHDDDSFESWMTVGDPLGGYLWIRFSCPSGWNSTKVTKVKIHVDSAPSYQFDIDCWDDYTYQQIGTNYWYTPAGDFTNLVSNTSQSMGWYTHTVSHTFQSSEFFIGIWCWDENGPYFGVDTHDSNIKVAGGIVSTGGVVIPGVIFGIQVYAETGGCKSGEDIAIQKDKGRWLVPSPGIKQFNNKKIEIKKAVDAEQEIFYEYDIKQIFKNKIKIQGTLLGHSSYKFQNLKNIHDKIIMLDENH